ncbi:hypothetical protein GM418_22640 [Maribellus comscasis]|uniref:Uncharacterized protein n=1 Tax=Maribellus comscasis TaxID=2681766 RepID=A0A6I6JTH6_9BACT|nr:hypothetical protein [Maribellus comscasis]QGY46356.1 hypothetical protein GM418_22640 [Maribellus comscasis]
MKTKLTFFLLFICFLANGQSPQVQELGKLYMSGKYDQTIEKANKYLNSDPENLDYKVILGRALTDKGNYKEAISHLQYAIDRDNSWRKAWGLGYLGTCYYMLSDFDKSESALKSCINLNATKNATRYSARRLGIFGYDSFYKDWTVKESKHIRFHFQNMSDQKIKLYIESREKAFVEINKFFESSVPRKIDFFVWNSRDDAKRIVHANLGFAEPAYCIVHSHFQQTKGHELTHVISNYSNQITQKTGLINEGTSVCFDLANRNDEKLVFDWIKENNQKIDIKDIWANWRKYPHELTYPLSGLFVNELISEFGKEKFLAFFSNQTYENAKTVFGNELDILIEKFENKYSG